jgi:hypothetical protein
MYDIRRYERHQESRRPSAKARRTGRSVLVHAVLVGQLRIDKPADPPDLLEQLHLDRAIPASMPGDNDVGITCRVSQNS